MGIASVTMVGQFPQGIDLHVRNLRWALGPEHHIYVAVPRATLAELDLPNRERVTYIPFAPREIRAHGFLNFWREFPQLRREHGIDPDWFLFMEQDIWFYAPPGPPDDIRTIRSFLPDRDYHTMMVGERLLHHRVWEGAQLVHGSLVRNAEQFGVDFSFVPETFFHRNRAAFEAEVGGPLTMTDYRRPDTMDEFGLYCALIGKTRVEFDIRAIHLRGPEVMHRLHPDVYRGATPAGLADVQQKLYYLDVLLAVGVYYIAGLWDDIGDLDWTMLRPASRKDLQALLATGSEWMYPREYARVERLASLAAVAKDTAGAAAV